MKSVFILTLLLFLASETVLTQTPAAKCPKFSIVGPEGITNVGEKMYFEVRFAEQADLSGLSFEWEISEGRVFEGQGTRKIRVNSDWVKEQGAFENVAVTVTVNGLPDGCENKVTSEALLERIADLFPSDEWSELETEDEIGRLDAFLAQLQNTPLHTGFIILYIGKDGKRDHAVKGIRRIIRHLAYRKFDRSRIEFAISKEGEVKRTQLWRIPKGGEYPSCEDCEIIKGRFQ